MALMHCLFYSKCMGSNISINVIIPTLQGGEQMNDRKVQDKYNYEKGLPVVYLLHGAHGNADSWIRNSNVERYAQDRGLAVIMASAENSFYQDMAHGHPYKTFFLEELMGFVNGLFPVSKRREDTFVGGFSMGGYGAWYLGLTAPEKFSKAASMSGALDFPQLVSIPDVTGVMNWDNILGSDHTVAGTDKDLKFLYERCVANGLVPSLYQSCGKGDILYPTNLSVRDWLRAKGADLTWTEGEGQHDWNFWDARIPEMFDWFLGR